MPVLATDGTLTRQFTNAQWDAMPAGNNGWTEINRLDVEKPEARRPFAEITPPKVLGMGGNGLSPILDVLGEAPIEVTVAFNIATVRIEDGTADGNILKWNESAGEWQQVADSTGTVTSVGLDLPASVFNVTVSPVTGSGTLTADFYTQADNTFFAGPTTGGPLTPTFRAMVLGDLPDIADERILGNDTGSPAAPQEITVGAALDWLGSSQGSILYRSASGWAALGPGTSGYYLQTQGGSANPQWAAAAGGGIDGAGSAGHVMVWLDGDTATYDSTSPFFWDFTNNELGIRTSSPSAALHVANIADTFTYGFKVDGSLSTNLNAAQFKNNGTGNLFVNIATASPSAGDPTLQWQIAGGAIWSAGIDNSDSDKFKLKNDTYPSDAPTNSGLTIKTGAQAFFGINNDNPLYDLDVANFNRAFTFINNSNGTDNRPSVTNGTGMGTGPTGVFFYGANNCLWGTFTTGSSPASNAVVFSVTYTEYFPTFAIPVIAPWHANSVGAFRIGSAGNSGFDVYSIGALSASTAYTVGLVWLGY